MRVHPERFFHINACVESNRERMTGPAKETNPPMQSKRTER